MAAVLIANPYPERGRRARQLQDRHPYSAEIMSLYAALTEVQAIVFDAATKQQPSPVDVAGFAARHLKSVVEVTAAAGPEQLVRSVVARFDTADASDLMMGWLHSREQTLTDRYLARACTLPVLEALGAPAGEACSGPRDERHCPRCGGLPQLAYFSESPEALVTGPRHLLCSRCGSAWIFPRLTCAGCGEEAGSQLPIYSEQEVLPQARVDGCRRCHRYLVTIDLRRDPAAIPLVDEMAALPLDLYAKERGMSKLTPNLVGF